MSEQRDFALKPRAQPGDTAFLLNTGRHRLAFDPFPGRTIVLAFLGSAMDPAAEAALAALSAKRRLVDDGRSAFFALVAESGVRAKIALEARFPSSVPVGRRRDGARFRRRPVLGHPRPDAARRR